VNFRGQRTLRVHKHGHGFTLVEVLAALAVLGTALFVLLDAQYTALRVNQVINEEVALRQFTEGVASWAEVQVAAGQLAGEGDFGNRYPGFTWSFNAVQESEDETVMLYNVEASIKGPAEERSLQFYVYFTGSLDQDTEKSGQKGGRPQAKAGASSKDSGSSSGNRRGKDKNKDKDRDRSGFNSGWDDDDNRSSRAGRSGRGGRSGSGRHRGSGMFDSDGF